MKKKVSTLLAAVITIAITVISFASTLAASTNKFTANADTEARIKRIENGLVPPLVTQDTKPMRLEARMAHFNVPGVSIAVIENGKIAWARGYGVRDLETKIPVNIDTVFQAASISKPVAAMAALKLVEAGKLNLDENINNKLKSWQIPENEFTATEKATLRRILSHRAGLTASGFPGYAVSKPIPSLVQILDGMAPANTEAVRVDIVPQRQTRYSGGGFTVMQQLMMDVSNKSFASLLQETVLKPIGMTRSAFAQPLAGPLSTNAASAHDEGKVVSGKYHIYPELAAAGLWTTPTDLARFAIELQQAANGKSARVLSPKMAQDMLTSQGDEWGLGIMLEGRASQQRFLHSGSNQGFNCFMLAFRQTGAGIVIMTNANSGRALIQDITRAVANEYGWKAYTAPQRTMVELSADLLPKYAGYYELSPENRVRVRIDNGKLIAQRTGGWNALVAGSDTTFFLTNDGVQVDFAKSHDGNISSLIVTEEGTASAAYPRATEPTAPLRSTAFYLRGSMNDWGVKDQMMAAGQDRYATRIALKPGRYEFKLGSEDFNTIDLGGSPSVQDIVVDSAKTLLPVGQNLQLNIEREGVYEFVLDATTPLALTLKVSAKN